MSNNWSFVNFGEVFAEPVRNGVYKAAEFQGSGMHIVNMKELFGYEFIGNQKMRKIELSNDEKERFLLKNGDLLFARRSIVEEGSGKISLIKGLTGELTFESSIIRVRLNLEKAYPLFYYYYFSSPVGKPSITALSSGVTVKGIRGSDLRNVKIRYPPLTIQQKIAAILSAYDDLIENNLKRIKLLEEMAQITYEEWFIRLKFPGHETTPVDTATGLPMGWEIRSLLSVAEFLNGYAFKPEDLGENGYPIIKIKELKNGVDASTPRNDGKDISAKYIVNEGDILFSWSASLEVVIWQNETGLLNQHLFKVIPNREVAKSFLYLALKECLPIFDNLTTGATMKHIKRKELDFVKIVLPHKSILDQFDSYADSIFQSILNLNRQNRLLKETRDILLPRLMTGMIDVEQLDLPEPLGELSSNLTQEPQAA